MPAIVPVVAFFFIANKLKIFDTYFLLIITNCMAVIPFVIWIMKGFFDEIPYQLEEAAMVDGVYGRDCLRTTCCDWPRRGSWPVGLFAFIFAGMSCSFGDDPDWAPPDALHQIVPGINIGHVEPHWGGIAAIGLLVIIPTVIGSW